MFEHRRGQILTPLVNGRIQIHKMKRDENIEAVRSELRARGLGQNFDDKATWTIFLTLSKSDEGEYFHPHIAYGSFALMSVLTTGLLVRTAAGVLTGSGTVVDGDGSGVDGVVVDGGGRGGGNNQLIIYCRRGCW